MRKISIIMPTYNRADLLHRSIHSILNQTFSDFELIIINDGSIDNTDDVISGFQDKRIKYEKFTINRGVNSARNRGLDLSRGEYVMFLDSDDELLPNALNVFLHLWDSVNDVLIGNIVTRCLDSETGEKIGYLASDNLLLEYRDIISRRKVSGEFRSCWKREAIGNLRFEESVFFEENILWWRLAKKWKFLYKDIPTVVYYKGSPLSLSSLPSQIKNALKMAKGIEILINEHGEVLKKCCPDRYVQHLNSAALFNLLGGNRAKAKKWAALSLSRNIFCLKSWIIITSCMLPKFFLLFVLNLSGYLKDIGKKKR